MKHARLLLIGMVVVLGGSLPLTADEKAALKHSADAVKELVEVIGI